MDTSYWGTTSTPCRSDFNSSLLEMKCLQGEVPCRYQSTSTCPNDNCRKIDNDQIAMDPLVTHTVKLLQYCDKLRQLIQAQQSLNGEFLYNGNNIPDFPVLKASKSDQPSGPFNISTRNIDNDTSSSHYGETVHLGADSCFLLLRRSVATLLAHIGFSSCNDYILDLLTDVAGHHLSQFTRHLRSAADQGSTEFPDIIERVFHEFSLGSVTCLHDFYQNRVVNYHNNVQDAAQSLTAQYHHLIGQSDIKPDDSTYIKIKKEPYDTYEDAIINPNMNPEDKMTGT